MLNVRSRKFCCCSCSEVSQTLPSSKLRCYLIWSKLGSFLLVTFMSQIHRTPVCSELCWLTPFKMPIISYHWPQSDSSSFCRNMLTLTTVSVCMEVEFPWQVAHLCPNLRTRDAIESHQFRFIRHPVLSYDSCQVACRWDLELPDLLWFCGVKGLGSWLGFLWLGSTFDVCSYGRREGFQPPSHISKCLRPTNLQCSHGHFQSASQVLGILQYHRRSWLTRHLART